MIMGVSGEEREEGQKDYLKNGQKTKKQKTKNPPNVMKDMNI